MMRGAFRPGLGAGGRVFGVFRSTEPGLHCEKRNKILSLHRKVFSGGRENTGVLVGGFVVVLFFCLFVWSRTVPGKARGLRDSWQGDVSKACGSVQL